MKSPSLMNVFISTIKTTSLLLNENQFAENFLILILSN